MMGETCCAKVWRGGCRPYNCANKNTKLIEGKWYCGTHNPEVVKKRNENNVERWNAKQAQFNEKVQEDERRNSIIRYLENRKILTVDQLIAVLEGKLA